MIKQVKRKTPILLLAMALSLSACASSSQSSGTENSWQEPAWMAQQRQQVEIYENNMASCFRELGADYSLLLGGGVALITNLDSEDDAEAVTQIHFLALEECYSRYDQPAMWLLSANAETYSMMLDVRECAIAHGFAVDEPPPLEVWQEQEIPWNPLGHHISTLPDDELRPLLENCSQIGPGRFSTPPRVTQ